MLDTDHQFDPDLLERLLNYSRKYGAEVIGTPYLKKSDPHVPVAGIWLDDNRPGPILDIPRDQEALLVGCLGAGGLFVKREVYKRVQAHFGVLPFTLHNGLSEDFSFCWRCKELGIPVHLALQIETPHLIRKPLWLKDYKAPEGRLVPVTNGKLNLEKLSEENGNQAVVIVPEG